MDQDAIMALTEQLVATTFSRVGFQPYSILCVQQRSSIGCIICSHDGINAPLVPSCSGLHAAFTCLCPLAVHQACLPYAEMLSKDCV